MGVYLDYEDEQKKTLKINCRGRKLVTWLGFIEEVGVKYPLTIGIVIGIALGSSGLELLKYIIHLFTSYTN
jgi:hypothetical protein